jgi:thioredoxin reductase (NADPH)
MLTPAHPAAPATKPDFDVAIIGGGPAGIAAAISIVTEGPTVAVLDQKGPGGQIATSSKIENVFGVGVGGKSGAELMGISIDQAKAFGTRFLSPFNAVRMTRDSQTGLFTIVASNRERVIAKAVVLALGASARRLEKPGVAELNNRGVYYGAPQYHVPQQWVGKRVGIIGGGNSAGQAGLFLSNCADCRVNVFVRGEGLEQDMSRYLVARFQQAKIEVHPHSNLLRVEGESTLRSATFDQQGFERSFDLDYLLIQIGAEPPTGWLEGTIELDSKGYILTDRDLPKGLWHEDEQGRKPLRYETSVPGVFAAGDAHAFTPNRMSCAVGEGHALAVSAYKYLILQHDREVAQRPHVITAA